MNIQWGGHACLCTSLHVSAWKLLNEFYLYSVLVGLHQMLSGKFDFGLYQSNTPILYMKLNETLSMFPHTTHCTKKIGI